MAGSLSGTAVVHVDGYDLLRFPDLQTAADLALPAGMPVSVEAAAVLGLAAGVPGWAPGLVLVHAGARPTRVLTREGTWEVPVQPLPEGRLRDTTGCGDAFAAGVLAGWRAGESIADAVRAGHAAAAVVAGVVGAQPPS
jgi:ribokinase